MNVIETRNAAKVIDDEVVLDDVTVDVQQGSIHGIVGANGAGKTTLLRLFNGVYQPSAGEIRLFGTPLAQQDAHLRQRVHLVSADGAFFPGFRVVDLLRYASLLYDKWDQNRCDWLLKVMELPTHRPIRKLSLGMKMQLRLAIALASRPDLLLLDEPTNGLDPVIRRQFLQLIVQEAARTDMTVVCATHRLEDLEATADSITVLYRGRVVLSGSIEEFKTDFHEVIAVADDPIEPSALSDVGAIAIQTRGKFLSCVVKGDTTPLCQQLRALGATHVDVQTVGFDDLFRALMQKEGYTRDAILLS